MNQIQPSPKALDLACQVLRIEGDAVLALIGRIDDTFLEALSLILNCHGRVIVSGIGKSGHIGRKIASTLASTGTPAYFVHPAEASHGDLGMIVPFYGEQIEHHTVSVWQSRYQREQLLSSKVAHHGFRHRALGQLSSPNRSCWKALRR